MVVIALVQLKYLDGDNIRLREIVEMYNKVLENNSKIQLVSFFLSWGMIQNIQINFYIFDYLLKFAKSLTINLIIEFFQI